MSKACYVCGESKPLSAFCKNKGMPSGQVNKCKDCVREYNRKYRLENAERLRAYDRERTKRNTPEYQRDYYHKNPDKIKAHSKVKLAIRKRTLISECCEVCGDTKTHGHHDDYSKPLDVRWLCPLHHKETHARRK